MSFLCISAMCKDDNAVATEYRAALQRPDPTKELNLVWQAEVSAAD